MKTMAMVLALTSCAASAQTEPVKISSGVIAGQIVRKVTPQYPAEAMRAHVNGSVVMHVIIGEDGIPRGVTVVSGPEMLRQAYVDAVKQWVYKPYMLNGHPVAVDTTITISLLAGGDEPSPQPVRDSSGVMAGLVLHKVMPQIPDAAKWAHVSGSPVLRVIIGEDGLPHEVNAISGPEILRQPYIDAVKQWVFKPYVQDGRAVPVDTTVSFNIDFDAPELPSGRIRIPSGELVSRLVTHPMPKYPKFTAESYVSGASNFHVVVGRDGRVRQLDVIGGPLSRIPYEVKAVKQYRYRPYFVDGKPVEIDSTVTLQPSFGR